LPAVLIVHSLLATFDPAFAIDEQEAKALAEAWAGYLRHTRATVNPRTRDLGILCMTMAAIELPRVKRCVSNRRAVALRAKQEAQAAAQASGRVVPLMGA
jgi:hypothetical protein